MWQPATIPVALKRLQVEKGIDTPLLCDDAVKEVAGYPESVSHRNTLEKPDLELPLRRHGFCIDTADPDAKHRIGRHGHGSAL